MFVFKECHGVGDCSVFVLVVKDMLRVGCLWVLVPYVAYMFLLSLFQIPTCLSYV
jgi:hypothetical protein